MTLPQPVDPAVDFGDIALRLFAATAVGGLIGLDREWRGKPVGIRTLALVALGSALVAVSTVHLNVLDNEPDAVSRVVQGIIQGVMAGIGFIGAGAILRHPKTATSRTSPRRRRFGLPRRWASRAAWRRGRSSASAPC